MSSAIRCGGKDAWPSGSTAQLARWIIPSFDELRITSNFRGPDNPIYSETSNHARIDNPAHDFAPCGGYLNNDEGVAQMVNLMNWLLSDAVRGKINEAIYADIIIRDGVAGEWTRDDHYNHIHIHANDGADFSNLPTNLGPAGASAYVYDTSPTRLGTTPSEEVLADLGPGTPLFRENQPPKNVPTRPNIFRPVRY